MCTLHARILCTQDLRNLLPVYLAMALEVGDWRLSDDQFLVSLTLPLARPRKLASLHTFPGDDRLEFNEATHIYRFDGCIVPRSVTSLLHQFASAFDPYSALAMMRSSPEWEGKRVTLEAAGHGTTDEDFVQRWEKRWESRWEDK